MQPPRWVLSHAYALLVWQVTSLVSLPIVLAHAQPTASANATYCVRQTDGCTPEGECPPTPPTRPAEDDPCRLVCVSDHGLSSWFDLVAPRLDVQRFSGLAPAAVCRHERRLLTLSRAYPPPTPPPEA